MFNSEMKLVDSPWRRGVCVCVFVCVFNKSMQTVLTVPSNEQVAKRQSSNGEKSKSDTNSTTKRWIREE